tara:strand:- start:1685 stop:1885 length:201 start_codon:yes stop_codon:yes gene_type:complete
MIKQIHWEPGASVDDEIYAAEVSGYKVKAVWNIGMGEMEECDPKATSSYEFMEIDDEKKTVTFVSL